MKRIFPIIVILISLSLLGIIMLQVSWFKDMIELRQGQLISKVEEAGTMVANELSAKASIAPSFKLPNNSKIGLVPPDDFALGMGRSTIAQHYAYFEINEKLQKAFEEKGLKDVKFEFAITSNSNSYNVEMQSRNFINEFEDSAHNKTKIFAINPESGSVMEGLVPFEHLFVIVPDFKTQVWESLQWMIVVALSFTLIIIAAFALTVHTLLRQKKLSEIKTDFINNMTHEFKTPLATISLAVDALKNEKVVQDVEKRTYFNNIIKEENKRMNKHVETILQAALLDKQELKLNMQKVHAHDLVHKALNNHQLQLQDKQGQVDLQLNAVNDVIEADEGHFTNLISNLIDNAIKYSRENLVLRICTSDTSKMLVIRIEDNGIGMNKETVKRVFEKFYRAHTGNVHNVKGFGLGMSYVKTVIDVHKGRIKVDSTLGKGSCFTIEVPYAE
ncbi:HAMP domain-containing histidine kinase [Segetibacter sp. 3557_3]|uniref:sensor histidine kinase n=1 Tax=Segetibacter sp. 3557_3 TaxID=2547429 RepID=UPI001059059A|nr:HAMP domain-containing sensor histidine kinase [Segetibacter sp. 3557_3]TDH22994.1 HAMP domain-containing histidine kinase [Segetibacter sp. 3557_3]